MSTSQDGLLVDSLEGSRSNEDLPTRVNSFR